MDSFLRSAHRLRHGVAESQARGTMGEGRGMTTAMHDPSNEGMRQAVTELTQALYHHEQWCESLYATLICRLPYDQRDVSSEAHRACRFGHWYHGAGQAQLGQHPGFAEVELEHQ